MVCKDSFKLVIQFTESPLHNRMQAQFPQRLSDAEQVGYYANRRMTNKCRLLVKLINK